MAIINLKSELSPGLRDEIDSIDKTFDELTSKVETSATVGEYCRSFIDTVYGKEFISRVTSYAGNNRLKILDIGFGRGESSLYLGEHGHDVHALEPSPANCSVLARASKKFGIPLHFYQGAAESIDRISETNFDLCIFNSSLHHCDDPVAALRNCKQILRSGGKVIAVNEPLLKFYRSKKWYFQKLEKDPIRSGNYGGNEHIYYYKEYLDLFKKSGFENVKGLHHIRQKYPRETIRYDIEKKILNEYMNTDMKILCKYAALLLLKPFFKKETGLIQEILKRLSLVPLTFESLK